MSEKGFHSLGSFPLPDRSIVINPKPLPKIASLRVWSFSIHEDGTFLMAVLLEEHRLLILFNVL